MTPLQFPTHACKGYFRLSHPRPLRFSAASPPRPRPNQLQPAYPSSQHGQTRSFLPNFPTFPAWSDAPQPQSLSATRTLPYAPRPVFDIIADVASYSQFLPYCIESQVTALSRAPIQGQNEAGEANGGITRSYPTAAILRVGYGSITEAFESAVCCDPGLGVVEAAVGEAAKQLRAQRHSSASDSETASTGTSDPAASQLLRSLRTRWTVAGVPSNRAGGGEQEHAKIELKLEFQFANPFYASVSQAATPLVAEKMVRAFERRVEQVLRQKR